MESEDVQRVIDTTLIVAFGVCAVSAMVALNVLLWGWVLGNY